MKKRLVSLLLSAVMVVGVLAGCGTTDTGGDAAAGDDAAASGDVSSSDSSNGDGMEGTHVFMFKSTGNSFGDLMYEGFEEVMTAAGEKVSYQSPAETTVEAQVSMIDELITQKIASLTISTNGDTGYDEVLAKAEAAGIKVVSVDSEVDPGLRVTHVSQASTAGVGSNLVQAAVLIVLGVDYEGLDMDMEAVLEKELANYSGAEINIGVLSASIDTPVQNGWIAAMEEELQKDMYKGKVNSGLDKKYGNDELVESTNQANAFVSEDKVDVIISPTTVGIAAAGQVISSSDSDIKLTGLGLPSEMQNFVPTSADDDAFTYVCPYMMLWDVIDLGRLTAAATLASYNGDYTGEVGEEVSLDAFGDYGARTFTTVESESGEGTTLVLGDPFVFYKGNMAEWIDKL